MRLRRKSDDDQGAQVLAFPGSEVVPVPHPTLVLDDPAETVPETDTSPWVPARLRSWIEQTKDRPLLPDSRRVVTTAGWYWEHAPQLAVCGAGRGLRTCVREVWLTLRGGGWLLVRWGRWVSDADWRRSDKDIYLKISESAYRMEKREHRLRLKVNAGASATGALVLGGGGAWATLEWPHWSAVGWTALVGTLNAIGHWTRPKNSDAPIAPTAPRGLLEGSPPKVISRWVVDALKGQGVEIAWAGQALMDTRRMEYRLDVTSHHEIKPADLRAVELFCNFPDDVVRMVRHPKESQTRTVIIRYGDPLAYTPTAPWVPTGSRSCRDPLDLGLSSGDLPFAPVFAGVHTAVLGTTGSGKTEGTLRAIVDRLSGCSDAVLAGMDLSDGPEFELWRPVFWRLAQDENEADELLMAIEGERKRRAGILRAIARDDDPTNDTTVWVPELGPYLFLIIDEFSDVAAFNGKADHKDDPNLLKQVERGMRIWRKYGIFAIMATQNAGTGDWGSTQLWRLINQLIVGPCDKQDTTMVFGAEKRDLGWTPHLLKTAQPGQPNDAGKAYWSGPGATLPDVYRSYRPESPTEVKRRARQRAADGLPTLTGGSTIDVIPIPDCLATIDGAFREAGCPEFLSADQVGTYAERIGSTWDMAVRTELRVCHGVQTRDKKINGTGQMRYFWADVQDAVQRAERGG